MRLSSYETKMADVVARALLPLGSLGGLTDGVDAGARFAWQIASSPWYAAAAIRLALWMVWLWPLLARRPRLFSSLAPAAQSAALEAIAGSPRYSLRELFTLIKLNACIALLGNPASLVWFEAYEHGPHLHAIGLPRNPAASSAGKAS